MKTRCLWAKDLRNRNPRRLPIVPMAQPRRCLGVGDQHPPRLRVAWVALALLVLTLAFFWTGSPAVAGPAWLPMSVPTSFTVTSVDFVDADAGWVTAHSPFTPEEPLTWSLLRTGDGGAHWESVYGPDPDLVLGPVCFLSDQVGWMAATASRRDETGVLRFDNYVLRTRDGGATWTKRVVVLDVGVPYLNDLVFVNSSTGFMVGSGRWGRGAFIFRTSDGGTTWHRYDVEGTVWNQDGVEAVSFTDPQNGWAVANWNSFSLPGEGSAILHTTDGGRSWLRQYGYEAAPSTGTQRWYWDVDFVDAQHGWVVGEKGFFLRTLDGGLTWLELAAPAGADLLTVDFLDPLEGWVAGRDGFLLHTGDGGDTWTREAAATSADVSDLELFDQTHGVAFASADTGEGTLLAYGEQSGFTDIASSTYREAIEGLLAEGLVAGYRVPGGLQFRPEDSLRRAQFAKMIVGAMGLPVTEELTNPFTDLGEDALNDPYPHEYVAAAYAAGITVGLTPTTFRPFADITRAQMVTMVVRAACSLGPDSPSAPPAGYTGTLGAFSPDHAESMAWAEYNGLLDGLQGFGAGWDPWKAATRGEAAHMVWKLWALLASG